MYDFGCQRCQNKMEVTHRDRWYEFTQTVCGQDCGPIQCTTIHGRQSCVCPPQQGQIWNLIVHLKDLYGRLTLTRFNYRKQYFQSSYRQKNVPWKYRILILMNSIPLYIATYILSVARNNTQSIQLVSVK